MQSLFNHLNTQFAQQFGPRDEPLPMDGMDDDDGFYDDVDTSDLPLPVSFPLGEDAE